MFEFTRALFGNGPLAVGSDRLRRFDSLQPMFQQIADSRSQAALLAGIAWTESDFIETARNRESGASGLMQIMPFHFDRFGWRGTEWSDPAKNIRAGKIILVDDAGLGTDGIRNVLARYGGFRTVSPNRYVRETLGRATIMLGHMMA